MFFATDGRAYLCCLDHTAEMTYGNIHDTTIEELWGDSDHWRIVRAILEGEFELAGRPCAICLETDPEPIPDPRVSGRRST